MVNSLTDFCRTCGAPTKTVLYTPAGFGQTERQRKVCSLSPVHQVGAEITLLVLLQVHNEVATAKQNLGPEAQGPIMIRLANLVSVAPLTVRQEFRQIKPE